MTIAERPALVGANQPVPLVTGEMRRYINLDYAASTPSLRRVAEAVEAFLPWYSSVHRGAGFKSQVSTAAYEGAREAVRSFVGARPEDALIFTRNTTDSINLLAHCLPEDARVIASAVEHHANMLPWRRRAVEYLPIPPGPAELLESLDAALRRSPSTVTLVAVTGASNVTGEIWPLREIAELAHRFGARVLVDAAQLAPHVPIDMTDLDVDYLALSGHKLYAPFGAGVLAGRPDWLSCETPFLSGGGAVDFVTLDEVLWTHLPDRQEAGSPNVIGAVALGVACQTLTATGMDLLAEEEAELHAYARRCLLTVPGLDLYTVWDHAHPHIGVLPFNLAGYHHSELAAILSAEHAIGVRHGCFCAHPLMLHLLRVDGAQADAIRAEMRAGRKHSIPGAVRMSLGIGTTRQDIDDAVEALMAVATEGPRWRYETQDGTDEYEPVPDPRPLPAAPFPMARDAGAVGESS